MSTPLFDLATPSKRLHKNAINLIGFEFDGTACFRKGARLGPDAIRDSSPGIECYSPYQNKNLPEKFYDLGNLDYPGDWERSNKHLYELIEPLDLYRDKIRLITLGGEHSISFAPIISYLKAIPNLSIIHLDAHADLRDGYEGYHYSHASIIRRVLDHFGPDHRLIQYGIRSGTEEEYQWMRENNSLLLSLSELIDAIQKIDGPIYLTLDLDFFDPAYLPGTGTPEPGGENFHSFIKIIKSLQNKELVGADIVELAPTIDPTGNSSVLAAKVTREIIIACQRDLL